MSRDYPARPLVGLGVIALRGLPDAAEVLLIRRATPPNAGAWSLPGGAQELGERAEAGARRELLEETGVTVGPLNLIAHVDIIQPDPAGRVQYHYTILDFWGVWTGGDAVAGSDVSAVAWVPVATLSRYAVSDEVRRVVERAIHRETSPVVSSGGGTAASGG